jgi:hypothetical protein
MQHDMGTVIKYHLKTSGSTSIKNFFHSFRILYTIGLKAGREKAEFEKIKFEVWFEIIINELTTGE